MLDDEQFVLIVDDDPEMVDILGFFLDKEGISAIVARNVHEALGVLETTIPRVILLDLMLPGDNGVRLLEHMHDDPAFAETEVIVISAHPFWKPTAVNIHPPRRVMRKPIRMAELSTILRRALA